jgi:hypothetical protein
MSEVPLQWNCEGDIWYLILDTAAESASRLQRHRGSEAGSHLWLMNCVSLDSRRERNEEEEGEVQGFLEY